MYGKSGLAEEGASDAAWKNSSFQRTSSAFTAVDTSLGHTVCRLHQVHSLPLVMFKKQSVKIFSSKFEFSRLEA